jgi:hypothetical protein
MYKFAFVLLVYLLELSRYSNSIVIKLLPILLFSALFAENILKHKIKIKLFENNSIYFFFIIIIIAAVLRNNNPDQSNTYNYFRLLNFLLFFLVFVQTMRIYLKKNVDYLLFFLKTIYLPFLALIILNLIGYFLNIKIEATSGRDGAEEICVLLGKIGVNMSRVDFPFSPGFNSYGSLVGVFFTFSLLGYFIINKFKKIFLISIILSSLTILMIDTRTAFFLPILILILLKFIYKFNKPKLLWLIPLVTVLGNLIIVSFLAILSSFEQFSFLERNTGDLASGNARTIIWFFSALEFSDFKLIHLIGYGEFGQFGSGASLGWANLFLNYENPELTSPHSLLFLILFDYGYLGLFLLIVIQYSVIKTIKKLWSYNRQLAILFLAFLIYWNFMGMTESFFGLYTTKIMIIFCAITYFALSLNNKKTTF